MLDLHELHVDLYVLYKWLYHASFVFFFCVSYADFIVHVSTQKSKPKQQENIDESESNKEK